MSIDQMAVVVVLGPLDFVAEDKIEAGIGARRIEKQGYRV